MNIVTISLAEYDRLRRVEEDLKKIQDDLKKYTVRIDADFYGGKKTYCTNDEAVAEIADELKKNREAAAELVESLKETRSKLLELSAMTCRKFRKWRQACKDGSY